MTAALAQAVAPELLQTAAGRLRGVLAASEQEIEHLGREFEDLSRETAAILQSAGAIVGCAESDRLASVLPGAHAAKPAAQAANGARAAKAGGVKLRLSDKHDDVDGEFERY